MTEHIYIYMYKINIWMYIYGCIQALSLAEHMINTETYLRENSFLQCSCCISHCSALLPSVLCCTSAAYELSYKNEFQKHKSSHVEALL